VCDTTDPVINQPPNIGGATSPDIEAASAAGSPVTYTTPTATDAVDGSVTVVCNPPSGSVFAIGTTTVTCTATDSAGNSATTTFTVTVCASVCLT
jgi:hypothetical protein